MVLSVLCVPDRKCFHSLPCLEILLPYQGSFISHVSSNYPRLLCYSHPINATPSQHGPRHLPSLPLPTRCFFFPRSSRFIAVLPSRIKNSSQSVGSVRLPGSLTLLVRGVQPPPPCLCQCLFIYYKASDFISAAQHTLYTVH